MGSCTAGGAYVPAMSDETIIVRKQGTIFLAGPPLVKAATGEVVSAEELGGADVHARLSGVADHYAADDGHALALVRRIVANLNTMKRVDIALARAARAGLRPGRARRRGAGRPEDAIRHRARSSRGSSTPPSSTSSSTSTRTTLVTGFAHIHGIPVGILGNNGILYSESALKAAHFIELCCQRAHSAAVPAEHHRLHGGARLRGRRHRQGRRQDGDGGRLRARCRRSRVIVGGSLRRRQLRHVRARLRPALPVHLAERAHLGDGRRAGGRGAGDGAAREHRGARARLVARWRRPSSSSRCAEQFEREGNPYYATARLWDDGIIAPSETRRVLALAYSAALNAPIGETRFGVFRM